jgi:hypothetical protein
MGMHEALDGTASCNEALFAKLGGEVQCQHDDAESVDFDPLLVLLKDVLVQRFFKWLQLAKWAGMKQFLLAF